MPARLDTSKPLRLIGVQIFEGTIKEVRKTLTPGWYPFVECDNSDKMGVSRGVYPVVSKSVCPLEFYNIDENLPRISISAIAGKNGSGKSSLIDIVYRIINNFAENTFLMKGLDETDEVGHAFGIEGRLHFEQDGVQKYIECNDVGTFYYELENGVPEEVKIHGLTEIQRDAILNGFFYTISVNYSLYAFNPADYYSPFNTNRFDYDDGKWLNYLFHKNDGYYLPMVLTPFREDGQINVNNENNLAKQRIEVLSLLFHSQKKEFLDDYVPESFNFRFNPNYWEDKFSILYDKPIRNEISPGQDILFFNLEQLWEQVLQSELKRLFHPEDSARDKNALFYLAYKTLKVCSLYPKYREASHFEELIALKKPVLNKKGEPIQNEDGSVKMSVDANDISLWFNQNKSVLLGVVKSLYHSTCNHITLKIHQCLDYLREERYQEDEKCLDVDKDLLKGVQYYTYDDMMRLLPPPFFITEVSYRKKSKANDKSKKNVMTLQSMSSGERQLLYSLSYIYYHIKNIASIKGENGKRVVGYHHINLIFDEAELYYHPEFQRVFIKRLLERLALCHINRVNIRSINIMIVTHSPFILSDIPESNVLYLGKEESSEVGNTFGANIYDLLRDSFFLTSDIGELAHSKIDEMIKLYHQADSENKRKTFEEKYDEFVFVHEHLGEAYLKKTYGYMLEQLQKQYKPKKAKEMWRQRLSELNKERDWLNTLLDNNESSQISN